jgi:hypothetical protein
MRWGEFTPKLTVFERLKSPTEPPQAAAGSCPMHLLYASELCGECGPAVGAPLGRWLADADEQPMHFIKSHIADLHNRQATSSVKELSSLGEFIGLAYKCLEWP